MIRKRLKLSIAEEENKRREKTEERAQDFEGSLFGNFDFEIVSEI